MAAAIQINGVTGSNTDLPINVLVSLTNANNTGVVSWAWSIVDQPPGAADALSATNVANPTFTPRKEGTYLLRLVTNAGTASEAVSQVVAAVRQLKTNTRVPAAGETSEADATDGWAVSVDELLRLTDMLRADPGLCVLHSGAFAFALNDACRVASVTTIKSGLPGQEVVGGAAFALAVNAADVTHPLFVVVGAVKTGLAPNNELFYARRFGLVQGLTGAPAVGDYVYVSNSGALALTPGTFRRVVGRVVRAGGGTYDVWFDGALAVEPLPTPLAAEVYAAAQADMAGANNLGTGVSWGKQFPAAPGSITFNVLDSANVGVLAAWQITQYGCGVYAPAVGAGNARFYARVTAQ